MYPKLLVCLSLLFLGTISAIEAAEDYNYAIGLWEGQWGLNGQRWKVTVKEILENENRAVIFIEYDAFNMPGRYIPAGAYEVNDAVFKPGEMYIITYQAPKSKNDYFLEFKKDGTGSCKLIRKGGDAGSISFSDLKKK
jgi:hypothetical protein